MSVTIEDVSATPFSLPLARASRWGKWGTRSAQDHVLVRVIDSDGAVGIAEATPRPSIYGEDQASVCGMIENHYRAMLVQQDPYDVRGLRDRLLAVPYNYCARAAVDIALHDLLAHRHEVPLASQLGGSPRPVPITYMLALRALDETLLEAHQVADRFGVRSFKVKLRGAPREDRELLEKLRRDGDPTWTVTADANGLYTGETAAGLVSALEDMDVAILEDPFPSTGLLQRPGGSALGTAVVADEHMTDVTRVRQAVALDEIATICIKPPRTGVLDSLAIRALCEASGRTCWIGSQGVSDLGALASAQLTSVLHSSPVPADLGTFLRQEEGASLLAEPVRLVDGAIVPPDRPASGAIIDPDKLEAFRVDR